MANTFKFGNKKWAVKKDYVLAFNDEGNNFKPLPFDFTRDSVATYVDSDGLIKTATDGYARVDYLDNTDGHLILEPARTNFVTNSKDYISFGFGRSVRTVSTELTPEGSADAIKMSGESGTVGTHRAYSADISVTSGVDYTISTFVKKGTSSKFEMTLLSNSESGIGFNNIVIDFDAGTVNRGNIEDYGSGWYRISLTDAPTSTTAAKIFYYLYDETGAKTYTADGNENAYIYGVQMEQGSYATSYIPTEGASVTRTAEVCEGAGSSAVFNDSEGVIFVETEPFIDGDFESQYISLSDGTTGNNFVTIQHRNNGQLRIYAGGFNTANIQFLEDLDMAQNLKIAVQYKASDYKLFVNGTEYSVYSSGGNEPAVSGLSQFDFNVRGGSGNKWVGKTKQVKIYNTALTDAELTTLTT